MITNTSVFLSHLKIFFQEIFVQTPPSCSPFLSLPVSLPLISFLSSFPCFVLEWVSLHSPGCFQNCEAPYLSLQSTGIVGLRHHIWPQFYFSISYLWVHWIIRILLYFGQEYYSSVCEKQNMAVHFHDKVSYVSTNFRSTGDSRVSCPSTWLLDSIHLNQRLMSGQGTSKCWH